MDIEKGCKNSTEVLFFVRKTRPRRLRGRPLLTGSDVEAIIKSAKDDDPSEIVAKKGYL